MTTWTSDELSNAGAADELRMQTRRRDGTLRGPVTIWVVHSGDDLYVRSVNGRESAWFRGAQTRHEGHIRVGSIEKDVDLVETDSLNDELDAAYRSKYRCYSSSSVTHITSPEARAATFKLVPHDR
jgi:hypothetical protein